MVGKKENHGYHKLIPWPVMETRSHRRAHVFIGTACNKHRSRTPCDQSLSLQLRAPAASSRNSGHG